MIRSRSIRFLLFCPILALTLSSQASPAETATASSTSDACSYDRAEMLALDKNAFDQDFEGGWRSVAHRDGCKIEAAKLIRDYIEEHDIQSTMFFFHEAQLRAMAGQTEQALQLFSRTRKSVDESDRIGWNHYVDATMAFLRNDRDMLLAAMTKLANTPKPDGWDPVDVNGNPVDLIWPPNLNVVNGFIECFERDYEWAYSKCSGPLLKTDTKPKQ